MTILCALNEPTVGTWYAADSLISDADGMRMSGKQRKFIRGDGFAWGFAGMWGGFTAMLDASGKIKADWSPAKLYKFMRDTLIEFGFTPDEAPGRPMWFDLSSIFVTADCATQIDGDGTTIDHGAGEFVARGSGSPMAEAAAWTLARQGARPKDIVTEAVRAAIALDVRCGGELYVGLIGDVENTAEIIDYAAELAGVQKITDRMIAEIRK